MYIYIYIHVYIKLSEINRHSCAQIAYDQGTLEATYTPKQ